MIKGLIVGHRNIGEGLLNALESISGSFENIIFISNNGLSKNEIAEKIKEACKEYQNDDVMIFIDVYGGSCSRAAKIAKLSGSHIVTGLNLPMLLSFVNKRNTFSFDELCTILETDGKRGIKSE